MTTQFCPACGHENPDFLPNCESCGARIDVQSEVDFPRAPIRWNLVGLLSIVLFCGLGALAFIPGLRDFRFEVKPTLRLAKPSEVLKLSFAELKTLNDGHRSGDVKSMKRVLDKHGIIYLDILLSRDGVGRTLWAALWFALVGLFGTLVFRRRIGRELGLAVFFSVILQAVFWLRMSGFSVGSAFGSQLMIIKGDFLKGDFVSTIAAPSLFFVFCVAIMQFVAAQSMSALATAVIERVRRKDNCLHCGEDYPNNPTPPACPHCRVMVRQPTYQWSWVFVVALATAWLFSLGLKYGGSPLKFYYHCAESKQTKLSATCQEAIGLYNTSVRADKEYMAGRRKRADVPYHLFIGRSKQGDSWKRSFVLVHPWKYIAFLAPLFMIGPFLLGWRLRGGALQSAGLAIPVNWLAATIVAFLFFGFAGYEGAFVAAMRMHMLALLGWGVAGFVGALIGYRLGSSARMAADEAI
ncbi:MAG: zinc ribbon domain-containing protein [Myxococcales bacterium]|nr:zinc ribbon domain-containing protein [Myxococcales bacterium]